MAFDEALTIASIALNVALGTVLVGKRIFRHFPVFFFYICFEFVSDSAGLLVLHRFPGWYPLFYLIDDALDTLLYLGILVEIGKNLLRYNQTRLSRQRFVAIPLFALAFMLALFSIGRTTPWGNSPLAAFYYLQTQEVEVLEFAAFLALAWWSSLRKLRWPPQELRFATGLGISAFAGFIIAILHARIAPGTWFRRLDMMGTIVDLAVLAYWLYVFWVVDDSVGATPALREKPIVAQRDGSGHPTP